MIIDTLSHAPSYYQLGPRFFTALEFLRTCTPGQIPDGRVDLQGDALYALFQSYRTTPVAQKKFEAHRRYADVQFLVSGRESIVYAPLSVLNPVTAYDEAKDFTLYETASATTPLLLLPGTFAIFLPQDGHKPGCDAGETAEVRKIVLTVRL